MIARKIYVEIRNPDIFKMRMSPQSGSSEKKNSETVNEIPDFFQFMGGGVSGIT